MLDHRASPVTHPIDMQDHPPNGPSAGPSLGRLDSDALVGVLAHELRTPITTIYAGSAVLARDEDLLPAMRRELAADVNAEAARLYRAVEDLLVLTRLEHHALSLLSEPTSLVRAIDVAADFESSRWPGLVTSVRHDGTLEPVAADGNALGQALRNLIANIAWRAGGPYALEIILEHAEAGLACRFIDRTNTLGDEDIGALFDLPVRAPRPGLTSPGLAMFVADQLIRTMGGRMWAQRAPNGEVEIGLFLGAYDAA